jgi:Phage portal protein
MGFRELFVRKPDVQFDITIPAEMTEGMTSGGTIAPRISRSQALQVPAVLRSRNLIAGTLARLPMHIRDKNRNIATPTTLLEQIDPDVPNVVTFSQTYEDLLFEGISWWRVTEVGWHGYPIYAQHINVDRVSVSGMDLPTLNSHMVVGPFQVRIDGIPVPDDEVIRFDSPNPPLLVHAARAIRACLNLDITAANYAETPTPLGAFTPKEGAHPRENKKDIEELLDTWETARRRRVWGYIGGAWEIQKLQFDAEQIQLAEQRQHAVLEIARAAGIDPEDLGVSTTSRTYQNSEQRRQDLLDFTLTPYSAAIEQRLSMRDVLPRGYEAKVNFDGFLRSDTKGRAETYAIGKPIGMYTEEEIRELEDRPSLTPSQRTAMKPIAIPVEPMNNNGGESPAVAR